MKKTVFYCDICKSEVTYGLAPKVQVLQVVIGDVENVKIEDICDNCSNALMDVIAKNKV